jgi:peptide/nickel transport system ATP-binding protein
MNAVEVQGLCIEFGSGADRLQAVRDVSFRLERNQLFGIVGESGSGKSMTALSLMGLLPRGTRMTARTMRLGDLDLMTASSNTLYALRGRRMAMIFQDPMNSLNPLFTIGNQLEEAWLRHLGGRTRTARERAVYLLERVGIERAGDRLGQYPHQLSGGLRQRVMIAMALMCNPDFIIADEPTTALDVTTQLQVLRLLRELREEFSLGILLITHDLGVVAQMADDVAVMHAGRFVETGSVHDVFKRTAHPYTKTLLAAVPTLGEGEALAPNADIQAEFGDYGAGTLPLREISPGHRVRLA